MKKEILEKLYYILWEKDFEDWYNDEFIPHIGKTSDTKKENMLKDINYYFKNVLDNNHE